MKFIIKRLKGSIKFLIINEAAKQREAFTSIVKKILDDPTITEDRIKRIYDATEAWIVNLIDNL